MHWDIFCKVIDNHGDIGVCWRLCAQLAARGQQVQLWIDDPSALQWMAPAGHHGVAVRPWGGLFDAGDARDVDSLQAVQTTQDGHVVLEAFGCDVAPEFIAICRRIYCSEGNKHTLFTWINLEYLSAEPYVERCHQLPSLVQQGPAAGGIRWFFYPGFTAGTGGLLREPDLLARQASFDRSGWLRIQGLPEAAALRVSLFCYEPAALPDLLHDLAQFDGATVATTCHSSDESRSRGNSNGTINATGTATGTQLLVTAGRATRAVQVAHQNPFQPPCSRSSKLSISYLPYLPQTGFDALLWACDLNFVRGEDSLVRALWAGQPFIWQIYPQDDNAHHAKLHAFLDWLQAPPSLRHYHQVWNALQAGPLPTISRPLLSEWRSVVQAARARLLTQADLASQLIRFVSEKS